MKERHSSLQYQKSRRLVKYNKGGIYLLIRTLIVEDDPMVSSINESYLKKVSSFHHVATVSNGEDALTKIKMNKIDLVLLDIYMPKMNGLELLRKLRGENEKLDVITITAADSPEMIEEIMRLGVVDCILKPFDFKRFERALLLYKKRFSMFKSSKSIKQSTIDSFQYNNENIIEPVNLPKGIDKVTLEVIRNTLKDTTVPLTIQQLASETNISKITIRKYLEFLAENKEIKLDLDYKTNGRPSKLYSYNQ